jgi:hypothetical protein
VIVPGEPQIRSFTEEFMMGAQPRHNENRPYRYPMRRVVAVLDDASGVQTALGALEREGVDVSEVNLLTGEEGARLLDRTGRAHGLRARLLRLAQRGAYEGDVLEAHDRALEQGRHVIFVPYRDDEQSERILEILRAAGGHYLLKFRRWNIEVVV